MRICITIDDVIRAKTRTFGKVYKKYVDPSIDLQEIDLSTNDLSKSFPFKDKKAYNKFLYEDYPFEVFAEATVASRMLDKNFNLWHISVDDEYGDDVDILLANPYEFNTSIGYTCFFLSQIATRVREIYFPKNSADIWEKCDVLVTADPKLLSEKPEGKKTVKIEMPYNEGIGADFTYSGLDKFIEEGNNVIEKLK